MPWGNPQQTSRNFVSHLNLRHKFEYDTYVVSSPLTVASLITVSVYIIWLSTGTVLCPVLQDYEQDDDAALQAAMEASMFET